MNRTQHPSNNLVLGAPSGWNQGELPCGALPVTRMVVEGKPAIVSFWKPTSEELVALNRGSSVALWVIGDTMPPVSLEVDDVRP
jgi:hypothetical protein